MREKYTKRKMNIQLYRVLTFMSLKLITQVGCLFAVETDKVFKIELLKRTILFFALLGIIRLINKMKIN